MEAAAIVSAPNDGDGDGDGDGDRAANCREGEVAAMLVATVAWRGIGGGAGSRPVARRVGGIGECARAGAGAGADTATRVCSFFLALRCVLKLHSSQ